MNEDQKISNELSIAAQWLKDNHNVAIATVISTWGSSPRPVGSQLVVNDQRLFEGSVSGGCVETAVIEEAMDVMNSGEPRILEYGVSNDQAWEVGLACGGQIQVYVEPLTVG